jgi:hypothetical protein
MGMERGWNDSDMGKTQYFKNNLYQSVAYQGVRVASFDKAKPNSQFRGKYIRNNPRHPVSLAKSNRIAN